MSYPENGAKYRHEPKWMDEAKKAEGGTVVEHQAHAEHGIGSGEDNHRKRMQNEVKGEE